MDQGLQHVEAVKYFVPLFCYLLIELVRVRSRERLTRRRLEAEERVRHEDHRTMRHAMTRIAQSSHATSGCVAVDARVAASTVQAHALAGLQKDVRRLNARVDTCLEMMARLMDRPQPQESIYHPPKEQLALPAEIRYSSGTAGRPIDSSMN